MQPAVQSDRQTDDMATGDAQRRKELKRERERERKTFTVLAFISKFIKHFFFDGDF